MKTFAPIFALALLLAACQSSPSPAEPEVEAPAAAVEPAAIETPAAPEPAPVVEAAPPVLDESSVTASSTGFSPLAQAPANTLAIGLHFANPDLVQSWTLDLMTAGDVAYSRTGQGADQPPSLLWDGKTEAGAWAAEGPYTARLTVNYGERGSTTALSDSFFVDTTPPSGSIAVTPNPYNPGAATNTLNPPTVTFDLDLVQGGAAIADWRLGVIHPDGRRFFDFISQNHRDDVIEWNGRDVSNNTLEGGVTYGLELIVVDKYGNTGIVKGELPVAAAVAEAEVVKPETAAPAPVTVTIDGQLVASLQIYFHAYSADLGAVSAEKKALNVRALTALADALRSAPNSRISVVGHANKVFWNDAAKGEREQQDVLLPLSLARAEAVREALVDLGLDASAFTVKGVGADNPVADFSDLDSNWKNRRVAFDVTSGS